MASAEHEQSDAMAGGGITPVAEMAKCETATGCVEARGTCGAG